MLTGEGPSMRRKNLDLVVALCIGGINIAWTQIPNRPVAPGILLVLPLTFILPGYTLTKILFRARSRFQNPVRACIQPSDPKPGQPVEITDQIVLSLGLSLAIDVLVGVGLNILPIGLQASSWAVTLGLITTVLALFTVLLRQNDDAEITRATGMHVTASHALLLGLAGGVLIVSVWLAIIRPLNPDPSFTQLWMLPAKNSDCSVFIGVQSFETTSVTYRVVMSINNTSTHSWSSILLSPQQKWSQSVAVTPGHTSSLYIQVLLYRTDKPDTIYRSTHIILHAATNKNTGQIQQQCKQGGKEI